MSVRSSAETVASSSGPGKAGAAFVGPLVLAQFGVYLAFITPLAISLSIRVAQIAPGKVEYLGYITGSGALVTVLAGPLLGALSDRTRCRFGRRRPFVVGGAAVGVAGLVVMALAPGVGVLGLGWVLAALGWQQALTKLVVVQADLLPPAQRGRVAGLGGFATMAAPFVGVSLANAVKGDPLPLLVLPGVIGAAAVLLFALMCGEPDSRGLPAPPPLTAGAVFRSYLWDCRRHRDFTLVWLGRFAFYFGLTLVTTFTAFFFAARLAVPVPEAAGTLAALAGAGAAATAAGSLGGGFLSDRLGRRRVFVLLSGTLYAAGAATMALSTGLAPLVTGSLICAFGLGLFSAVDQALALDVLPERATDAGRYTAILQFATSIPHSAAPAAAPLLLNLAVDGTAKNYTLLYLVAGAATLIGGLIALRVRSAR
ncbi:MFS-type transporter involved in bile tolerance (Atg22 family) [Actinocorallia herbida]|uniref:MFS-type transporter involved in bile tolerance (Atg22 family) n=1 Tax=Actinocorallia herbida TaxID=58109 RepID=A0A3N1CVN5_9ACTN|nr:MFS transporter [Actinocorallia herbida]ROO85336.1 MFS-type transporter involved in bile tolerance (Atg22 family) [Actinocorallia herbida]